ncbi:hypothetical protein [Bradyrhizobium niftali]|jgi:hypothetical protein|uniref:Uncharacterized protein n=1 Tax=Bradyrhizobium niftali TaxID=2560055 RepID=A0A4Y9L562_9BRAD|nr:hypothetical protein [Bradyrhizobium niftali]TFV37979.1 hypothetical protein E4K65_42610 [Bradyrhizobium niftali]
MPDTIDFGAGPAVVVFQPPGRIGGIIPEALSQEGISFVERPIDQVGELKTDNSPRLAIVIGAPANPSARDSLRQWVEKGGSVILLWCDQWPANELRDWFGIERQSEDVEGGYLWPAEELAIPGLSSECLQLIGRRFLYRLPADAQSRVLALGSAHPTAAIAFDATRDGFADDEWFWAGQELYRYSRGRTLIGPFEVPGIGPVTPTTAGSGDFTGDGFRDNLIVCRDYSYAILRNGAWVDGGTLQNRIRHVLTWNPGAGIWPIQLFLEDGSFCIESLDGGRTWSSAKVFAPDGKTPIPTDFGYSYEYLDDSGVVHVALNLFSQGAFFTNFGAGWILPPVLPNIGPKYLYANVIAPTIGYASDAARTGLRDQISLLVYSNVYARDPVSGTFNYPLQFHKLYSAGPAGRHPLVVNRGRATAVLYDIERTIYQLQQGLDHDPNAAIIMAGGLTTFNPVINVFDDWVDYTQLDLPQADLHERLLRVMVTSLSPAPIPRLWYWPNGLRSVASLSHDVEISVPDQNTQVATETMRIGGMAKEAKRHDTFFVLMTGTDVNTMSRKDLAKLEAEGHQVTIHFDTFGSTDFTAANFQMQSNLLRERGVNPVSGNRDHGLSWLKDYLGYAIMSQPETVYDSSFGGGPGYSHCGSVLPYRLYSLAGPAFESFDEISHGLMDIADGDFYFSQLVPNPETSMVLPLDDLFERAQQMVLRNHSAYYGFFDCLFHPVVVAGLTPPIPEFFDRVKKLAQFMTDKNIPSLSMKDVAVWWRARRKVQVRLRSWDRRTLRFSAATSEPLDGVTLVLPQRANGMELQSVTDGNGGAIAINPAVLDGNNYGMVTLPRLDMNKDLAANYS